MKIKNIILLALASMLGLSACSLDENPKGTLTPPTFYSSQDELNMSVYALYKQVANFECNTNQFSPMFQGDDMTTNPGSNKQRIAQADAFNVTVGNIGLDNMWQKLYSIIKAANDIVLNAARTPVSEKEINIALGQAKFWRAVSYFYLVRYYGKIPITLETSSSTKRTLADFPETYAQIVSDLQDCINTLPTSYADQKEPRYMNGANIYITKQAAQSTLVAVYMQMAGYPLKETKYYAEAAKLAKEVIDKCNSGEYEYILEPQFKNVYSISHNYTNETVVGFNLSDKFGQWSEDFEMTSSNYFEFLGGWGDAFGEIKFWKDYPDCDRKNWIYAPTILVRGSLLENGKDGVDDMSLVWYDDFFKTRDYQPEFCLMSYSVDSYNDMYTQTAIRDFDPAKPPYLGMTTSMRVRIVRYSELLLWYAESQARAEGTPSAFAYECVNRVRRRAGLPDLPAGLSGAEFADACLQEHGWEVCGYFMALVPRRDDMVRMELMENYFNQRKANEAVEVAPGLFIKEKVLIPDGVTWKGDKTIFMDYPALDSGLNPNLK